MEIMQKAVNKLMPINSQNRNPRQMINSETLIIVIARED